MMERMEEEVKELIHFSHEEHPLILSQVEKKGKGCHGCGEAIMEPQAYICSHCDFFLHKRCAKLPPKMRHPKHSQHPLVLHKIPAYKSKSCICNACGRSWNLFTYHCSLCEFDLDVFCADVEPRSIDHKGHEHPLVNLPMEDPTPNLLSRSFPQKTVANILHPALSHKPFLSEEQPTQTNRSIICSSGCEGGGQTMLSCEACFEPIIPSDPHYKCTTCNYFLHVACQNLPTQLQTLQQLHRHPLSVLDTTANYVASGTLCDVCRRRCNGISYTCSTCPSFHVCVKCLAAAFQPSVVHKAHKHVLDRTNSSSRTCKACGKIDRSDSLAFGCEKCDFYIGIGCCLLPPTVRHRWDKHLLILMFPPYAEHPGEFYCEICKEEMDPNLWMYHCRECDQSFHLYCLPPIKFRNMKLGRNLVAEDHPDHPLISVFKRNYKSLCVDCGRRLYEDMALECSPCRFYLCMDCAEKREWNEEKKSIARTKPTQAAGASTTSTGCGC